MKTAKDYLCAAIGYEPTNWMDHATALATVQLAIDDAATLREQVRQGIADYFGDSMPLPPLPELPANTPPVRLGERAQVNVFPPACPRCLLRRDQCVCPPMFPREEPPF